MEYSILICIIQTINTTVLCTYIYLFKQSHGKKNRIFAEKDIGDYLNPFRILQSFTENKKISVATDD